MPPKKADVIRHMVEQHGWNHVPGGYFDSQPVAEIIAQHAGIDHPAKPPTSLQPPHSHETENPTKWHRQPPQSSPIFRDRRQVDTGTTARSDILAEERKEQRGF